ncbi:hypothetical protein K9U39_15720 [Rhodoblastus acidophilus]|uniref:Uncharacterized protein n=1 Tax=Candidatus Rhodoblastus alkanivorans TaxID=2954117 RepID=A0ABS9Z111_9HYPH|nr:hypothetical protein [Candidatus Rhodoblastus alkanivorans]MCI4680786.1 hypothetical protein [Candidatus Rhodoblastus alkanivorans]MCI4681323.1 hypothetical protein [Candidatus Rhodoblastus alkanivorans]MDI4642370.1 hypothetical protein [Rhodoblastus acidophilus]
MKPFNFLISLHARLQLELPDEQQRHCPSAGGHGSNRPQSRSPHSSASPERPPQLHSIGIPAHRSAADQLKTYANTLAQYHLRPEAKFLIGDFCDRGRTDRRHVIAKQILHIGKEANKWEEQHFLGEDEDAAIERGAVPKEADLDEPLRLLVRDLGERGAATQLQISRTALRNAAKSGVRNSSRAVETRIASELRAPKRASHNDTG